MSLLLFIIKYLVPKILAFDRNGVLSAKNGDCHSLRHPKITLPKNLCIFYEFVCPNKKIF